MVDPTGCPAAAGAAELKMCPRPEAVLSNCLGGGILAMNPSLVIAKVYSPAMRPSRVVISITGPFNPELSFRSFRVTWLSESKYSSIGGARLKPLSAKDSSLMLP
jgi:hypothetical protein